MQHGVSSIRFGRWSWTGLAFVLLALPAVALGALAAAVFALTAAPVLLAGLRQRGGTGSRLH